MNVEDVTNKYSFYALQIHFWVKNIHSCVGLPVCNIYVLLSSIWDAQS